MSIKQFGLFDSKETENYICHKGINVLANGNVGTKPTKDISQNGNTSVGSSEAATQKETLDISNDGKTCSLCRVKFDELEEQRAHFKLDWHKYNVKQMLMQKDSVKEEVFEDIISGDISSISGSDSESDSDEGAQSRKNLESNPLMTLSLLQSDIMENQENFRMEISNPKVYFVNNSGNYMSVYREVLFSSKDFIKTIEEVECKIENLPKEKVWSILMTGGGHFAGAVFSGNTVLVRKTFHRYTVRAKRGTAQGIRDGKQGGHQPKSAGASLRRYNEVALVQDIQNLLESWSEHIERCDKIFIRVPNNYKGIFFEGKKPPFKKDDPRIRNIPFATRRATCKELEKVHRKLSTVEIHAENHFQDVFNKKSEKSASRSETRTQTNRIYENEASKEELETQVEKINEDDEGEYETSKKIVKKKQKDQRSQKLPKNKDGVNVMKQTEKKERQVIPNICVEFYEAISSGNVEETKRILEEIKKHDQEPKEVILCGKQNDEKNDPNNFSSESDRIESKMKEIMKNDCITRGIEMGFDNWCVNMVDILNQTFQDYNDETVLHLASRLSQTDTVRILLEAGADPTVKDSKGRVPFNVAKGKETRSEFRRFMASHPNTFDYKKAQIPSPLTTEMEEEKNRKLAEKKKAQAKARKQRLKEKKADEKQKEEEKLKKEQEERERDWFKHLSDREKRAVAAERRLGTICFNCSRSLQDLVPFERMSNKYCSTECVKKNRQMMETNKQ